MQLRDYQKTAVHDIRQSYLAGNRAPLFVLPTGGGKTVLFTYIAQNAALKGNRVWVLVHRVELLRQTAETLKKFGVNCGLVSPHYPANYLASVQVASVQTIVRRLGKVPAPDLIIIDEAHHATAGTWKQIINAYPSARLLGVTATPVRGDGKGLGLEAGGCFDGLILGPSMQELISLGYLVKPRVVTPSLLITRESLKTKMGDFDKAQASEALNKPSIIGDVVNNYRKFAHGRPAVAFCVNVAHAEHTAEIFRANGYRAASVDGAMDGNLRRQILDGLGNGQMDVVTSCDLIGEGVDIPAVGAAILLRPTKSTGLYLQQVGRALRTAPNKKDAIILDHVGNTSESAHGLPQMDREWNLSDGDVARRGKSKKKPTIRLATCQSCYTIQTPAAICEVCGQQLQKPKEIQQIEGELVELSDAEIQARLDAKKAKKAEQAQAQSLQDLLALAKQRGYKPGWAYRIYESRQKKYAR